MSLVLPEASDELTVSEVNCVKTRVSNPRTREKAQEKNLCDEDGRR